MTGTIDCPHCGHEHDSGVAEFTLRYGSDGDTDCMSCYNCHIEFRYTMYVDVTFETESIEAENCKAYWNDVNGGGEVLSE